MSEQKTKEERYCGNCINHCVYHYPEETFCMLRFLAGSDAIVPTLDVCENWKIDYEECFCVQEAMKKRSPHAK